MLKKLSLSVILLGAAGLWLSAANFWDSKPYTDWNDKEIDKVLNDSPWGDRMGVRTGERGVVASVEGDAKGTVMGETEVQVSLQWRTALPIRQALARLQFKGDTINSPEAKAVIDRQSDVYVLAVVGLPSSVRAAASNKEQLTSDTVIKIKNKPDLKPSDIQMPAPPAAKGGFGGKGGGKGGFGGGNVDLYYVFPKAAGITEADNELEFVSKMGKITVRKKYKLKDMVFSGKFEM